MLGVLKAKASSGELRVRKTRPAEPSGHPERAASGFTHNTNPTSGGSSASKPKSAESITPGADSTNSKSVASTPVDANTKSSPPTTPPSNSPGWPVESNSKSPGCTPVSSNPKSAGSTPDAPQDVAPDAPGGDPPKLKSTELKPPSKLIPDAPPCDDSGWRPQPEKRDSASDLSRDFGITGLGAETATPCSGRNCAVRKGRCTCSGKSCLSATRCLSVARTQDGAGLVNGRSSIDTGDAAFSRSSAGTCSAPRLVRARLLGPPRRRRGEPRGLPSPGTVRYLAKGAESGAAKVTCWFGLRSRRGMPDDGGGVYFALRWCGERTLRRASGAGGVDKTGAFGVTLGRGRGGFGGWCWRRKSMPSWPVHSSD
eukprot:Hpha_TRINITY_DN12692_c0_g1::TRINITY_DN12692_c0_g1_i1::g.49636::m.49636